MDPLPEIPPSKAINDTVCLIRNTFEEKLEHEVFPTDIANNLRIYSVDDNLSLKETAKNVFGIYRTLEAESDIIKSIEYSILKQHKDYLFAKNVIAKNQFLREIMKLRPCDIFADIYLADKIRYGLIEKCDLYPDVTRQFLDFRFNTTLHQCKRCFPQEDRVEKKSQPKRKLPYDYETIPLNQDSETIATLQLEPVEIVFRNFELNTVYEQPVKIKNISTEMQKVSIRSYPKLAMFTLTFEAGKSIAPGLYATARIKFTTDIFENLRDEASFISRKGAVITLLIRCLRDPPKLSAYVQISLDYPDLGTKRSPSSRDFSLRRQHALNDSIDCGSCFATEHVLISLLLINDGYKAKFFWLSEEEFCHQHINSVSTSLELTKECFWIYPTYFEMLPGDICQINLIFQPIHCGLQAQTLFLMCDNNTYRQIELIGDAVCFNRSMISVSIPYYINELERKKGHCIFMGHVNYTEKPKLTLSILNRSVLFLRYVLNFEAKDKTICMCKWFKLLDLSPTFLAPYSTTDITFEMECPRDIPEGYYSTNLRLFIKDVPIASLEADEKFLISTNGKPLKDITDNSSVVDVLVMEVEVACYVDLEIEAAEVEQLVTCEGCENMNCSCTECKEKIPSADLEFGQPMLELGILPIGADIKKDFHIMNLGTNELKWNIAELKYHIDSNPYVKVAKENNLSSYYGTLKPHKRHHITYNIVRKSPARYVSILVLFSIKEDGDNGDDSNFVAQSICVVTYEIAELNIVIETGQSQEPILCPMQMLYTGVPINMSFQIYNYSLVPGCFYLLQPIGPDVDKIDVEFKPQSGELKPRSKQKIGLQLTCYEVGILENILIPCFIGKGQEPILLRLLCVVDCVHVFLYLPTRNNEFQKILWPPKVIYEYDATWHDDCLCSESFEHENTINNIQSEHEMQMIEKSNDTLNDIKNSKIIHTNASEASNNESGSQNISKILADADSEIFLQDCVMEVRGIVIKEPKKITIHFENVTPKSAKYSIQSTNYAATQNNIKACLGPKCKKTEAMWEPMMGNYGILVQPETESGNMDAYRLIAVNIWIYANTWGIYTEEIILDIENITPFSFSLILEVVGCPLELPIAIGAITKYPTIRFGSVAFQSETITRNVVLQNISSIDVIVSWHLFYFSEGKENTTPFNFICDIVQNTEEEFEFNFTDKFYGIEGFNYIEIRPRKLELNQGDQVSIPIELIPQPPNDDVVENIPIQCFILGRIFTNENDRMKSNYFYRKRNTLVIEVTATLEVPRLDVEMEDNILRIYANDVAIHRQTDIYIKCIIRNPTLATIKAELYCMEPFSFRKKYKNIVLEAGQCKEIHLPCILTYDKILKWAPGVYRSLESKESHTFQLAISSDSLMKLASSDDKLINEEQRVLTFNKKLLIFYEGGFKNAIPIGVNIYYPNIIVKPVHVKFGYVLLGHTQKAIIFIYNLTGAVTLFEIFKTISTQELVITPPHGEIPKSTGMNNSCTKITIYFTPTECKSYHESIRVVTNIPQYYIDIPVKGSGSFNEKFE